MDYSLNLGDCLEYMKALEKNKRLFVVTDAPYGIGVSSYGSFGVGSKSTMQEYVISDWDNYPMTAEQFSEMKRISRHQIIFGFNYLSNILPPTKSIIVWDKKLKNDWDDTYSDCEVAWTSLDIPARVYRHLWMGACRASETGKGEGKEHPTQKPVALMRWIISKYTNQDDIILDPFMGSGSTIIAAHQLGRQSIGVEADEGYFETAKTRLAKAVLSPSFFTLPNNRLHMDAGDSPRQPSQSTLEGFTPAEQGSTPAPRQ